MTPKEKSDALISWWIDTIYGDNPTAEWKQNLRQEAALLPLVELFAIAGVADRYLRCPGCERTNLRAALLNLRAKLPKEVEL